MAGPQSTVKSTGIQRDHVESVDKVYVAAHLLAFGSWSSVELELVWGFHCLIKQWTMLLKAVEWENIATVLFTEDQHHLISKELLCVLCNSSECKRLRIWKDAHIVVTFWLSFTLVSTSRLKTDQTIAHWMERRVFIQWNVGCCSSSCRMAIIIIIIRPLSNHRNYNLP